MNAFGPLARLSRNEWAPPWSRSEHIARYSFASQYVSSKRVLDCAAGEGIGIKACLAAGAKTILAFDISHAALETAKFHSNFQEAKFAASEASALPLHDHSVEVYLCLETIEHLLDDRALLREATRVLIVDGKFICSTPNRKVTNPGSLLQDAPWNRFHVREYSKDELNSLLSVFFRDIEWFGQNPVRVRTARYMSSLAGLITTRAVVRLRQLLKLRRVIMSDAMQYRVHPWASHSDYEYLVAVCRNPWTEELI